MPYHTTYALPNFLYPDNSGFMFDLSPRTVIFGLAAFKEGGIYDIPQLPRWLVTPDYNGWSQWMEKIQKDYRFANVSDYNAVANLFPEVHDPWMFTEYLFEGTQVASAADGAVSIVTGIVEPPLVSPMAVTRVGGNAALQFINDQPTTHIAREERPLYELESQWQSDATAAKFWTSELNAIRWSETLESGETNTKFTRLAVQRRVVTMATPAVNSGVRTNRHRVWSRSTRWGYSQNIPPRQINLTGPKEYFRPDGVFTSKIVPHVTIRSGSPIYDNLTGAADGQQAAFMSSGIVLGLYNNAARVTLADRELTGIDGAPDAVYTYTVPASIDEGTEVPLPKLTASDIASYRFNEQNFVDGDLVHRGCAFWHGQAGTVRCRYWVENESYLNARPELARPVTHKTRCAMYSGNTAAEAREAYTAAGGTCPYYTPQGPRVLVAFEGEARTEAQLNKLNSLTGSILPGSSGMPGLGGSIADRLIGGVQPNPIEGRDPNQGYQRKRVEITYSPETVPVQGKQTYHDTPDGQPNQRDPEGSLRVLAGTGFFPLDEKANEPFRGVDTPFFGTVNQINYRVLQNVQHCYVPEHCDPIITTRGYRPGFLRGRYSNINFVGHALALPGYPAVDGTDSYCHQGDGFCPYNRVDRRAAEFDGNYKLLITEILQPFRLNGIDGFGGYGISEGFVENGVLYTPAPEAAEAWFAEHPNAMCCAVRPESGDPPVLGHWHPVSGGYRIFFFYDRPSWDDQHKLSHVAAHIIQFDNANAPVYMTVPHGLFTQFDALYGGHTTIPWLVELHDDYRSPHGNAIYATNGEAFWGGRSPEYKDHNKRGREIVAEYGSFKRQRVPTSNSSNQFGGVRWGGAPAQDKGSRGYWTDADGDYFITGTGTAGEPAFTVDDPGFVGIEHRIQNIPPATINGAYPINGVPGITMKNPTNPALNRTSAYASVGTTWSNDTKQLLDWFRAPAYIDGGRIVTNWETLLPEDHNSDLVPPPKVQVAPPAGLGEFTPVERYWYRCNVCQLEATEEEVNYLKTLVAYAPIGVGTCRCPRNDNGDMVLAGRMTRIPPATARGYVDVWAPPGTTVKHDAFFWKAPTLVSRVTETQITNKLGRYNATGGGYTFDTLSPAVEQMGRLPIPRPAAYNMGLSRQIIAPWATPGESLSTLRGRVQSWFGLNLYSGRGIYDIAYVSRMGVAGDIRVAVADEGSFTLQVNDVVHYERELPDGRREQVGLLVGVSGTTAGALSLESMVVNDTPVPSAPGEGASLMAIALYQQRLREWLLGAVKDSIYQWASSAQLPLNALLTQLASRGADPHLAETFDPGSTTRKGGQAGSGAGPVEIDERVIGPYGGTEDGGLKMITQPQLQRLRNRILPMLAYDLSRDDLLYTAGGDFTTLAQLSNQQRFVERKRTVPTPMYGTIPSQIIAATQTGRDSFVEWSDPELEITGRGRAYYPVGSTWWRLNQKVGHIRRDMGTNPLHMDADPDALDAATYQQYLNDGYDPYTGDNIVSTVTFFLHGRIPMDKEVVKAYLVFAADDGPSAAALGCLGKYDGYEGTREFHPGATRDGFLPGTLEYKGNEECFWQHFHPWITTHETDIGSYKLGTVRSQWNFHGAGYSGPDSRNHWLEGGGQDPGTPYAASDDPEAVPLETAVFEDTKIWRWRSDDEADRLFYSSVDVLGMSYLDDTYGFGLEQPFLGAWTWGENITQLVTEHALWKELTYDQYAAAAAKYSTQVLASVNGVDAQITFPYYAEPFRDRIWPRQLQGIAGWLNYAGFDTAKRFARKLQIETKVPDTSWANGPQVIVQEAGSGSGSLPGGATSEAGNAERVLDITAAVKTQYNNRVTRFYRAPLGVPYEQLFGLMRSKTDTNITEADPFDLTISGLAKRFHTEAEGGGEYAPDYWWNYRYFKREGGYDAGMWITDPWHTPELVDDKPADVSADGDPLSTSADIRRGRISDATAWDTQGLDEEDGGFYQYHPIALCESTDGTFVSNVSDSSRRPAPATAPAGYWRNYSTKPLPAWFTMDLRQTPYEMWRRPWRYDQPTIDSTSATCPNVTGCWVAAQGLTVGQLYEQNIHRLWGATAPSTSSSRCSVCNTPLTGVTTTGGDGVVTVKYDTVEESNAILNAVEVSLESAGDPLVKHGFVVEYYNSLSAQWRVLFAVTYDPDADLYDYPLWNGTAFVHHTSPSLPSLFRGWKGNHLGQATGDPTECHFVAVAAQKIRFRVPLPAEVERTEPVSGWLACSPTPSLKRIEVAAVNRDLPSYIGRSITLADGSGDAQVGGQIVNATSSGSGVYLFLDFTPPSAHTQARITWTEYVGQCAKFRAYGYPYRRGEVVMTPPGFVQDLVMSPRTNTFALSSYPSQICRMSCTAGADPSVPMTEVDEIDATFQWSTETVSYAGKTFRRITAGQWYYDNQRNVIVVPTTFDLDGTATSIWDLNQGLYTAADPLLIDTLPSKLTLEYFTGLGVAVDVDIEAHGIGPSYQLEPECIGFIANNTDDTERVPSDIRSDTLPELGMSVRLAALGGERMRLRWGCYNHIPVLWTRSVGWVSGNELPAGGWNENTIMSLWTGNQGYEVSKVKAGAFIRGKATGVATLYGAPGVMLSGEIAVYAKAYTTRSFNTAQGPVTTYERTGGYKQGALVFKLMINESLSSGRKSISCGVPRVLVYLRERDPTQRLQ